MPFEDFSTLIAWLVQAGGAGIVSYVLLAQMQRLGWLRNVTGPWVRVIAFIQAAVIGIGAAYLGGALGVYPQPETLVDVLDLAIAVGVPAGGVHQLTHGFWELGKKQKPTSEPSSAAVAAD